MKKNYLIVAMMTLCLTANAKTSTLVGTEQETRTIQKADAAEDDVNVVVNGFKCSLNETSGTFSIVEIESLSGEDLIVPSRILYKGKEYRCETVNMNSLRGELNSDNGYKDTKITPNVKSVTFSEGIKTLKGHFALSYCKKVTIPSSVESIEYAAFNYGISAGHYDEVDTPWWQEHFFMTNFLAFDLEEFVVDKDNLHYTTNDGMLYTKDMKTLISCPRNKRGVVVVPEGVERIANGSFSICNRITEIKLPSTVKYLYGGYGEPGFHYCLNLEKVNIPEGIEELYGCSFRHCDKLKSLTLPSTMKTLNVYYERWEGSTTTRPVFGPMYSLEELNWENTSIETLEGTEYELLCASPLPVKNFKLPKNVKIIISKALYGINPPTELHLPASIESLGEQFIDPFHIYDGTQAGGTSCSQTESNIKDIYCYWNTPLEVADNIFGYVSVREGRVTKQVFPQDWANICTLHVPAGTSEAYRNNSVWGKFKNIVEFVPSGIDTIADNTEVSNAKTGIYTLHGVKIADSKAQINKLQDGIYIIDGKKILVNKK